MSEKPTADELREAGRKPVWITRDGRLFIGDDEIRQPIEQNSVSVSPWYNRFNRLTLTFIVGEVNIEARQYAKDEDATDG